MIVGMADYDPREYGARWAAQYDDWHTGLMDDEGAVAVLSELADGAALEFGVGTGRLAIPLAARGIDVVGVDISPEMLAELAAKPGGDRVTTILGDMTTVQVDREFPLVYIAFSSIFVLPTQQAQVQFFRNAAAHLRPGGRFVLETMVVSGGDQRTLRVATVDSDRLVLSAGILDPVTSYYNGTWVVLEPTGMSFFPVQGRNLTHAEMDLMAQLAGLTPESRWGDWNRGPFTAESRLHISVYRKPHAD